MVVSFDTNLLSAYYQAKAGVGLATSASSGSGSTKAAPTPPWSTASQAPRTTELVRQVMAGRKFIDPSAAKLDVNGASDDYRKLFGLYQGLVALQGLAEQAGAKNVGETQLNTLRKRFDAGMTELAAFLDQTQFKDFRVAQGATAEKAVGTSGVKRENADYSTKVLHTGAGGDEVAAFQGDVRFSLKATEYSGTIKMVDFDLAEMGATPRTMSNVVLYLNGKLEDAGVFTRFANVRTPGGDKTAQVGGKSVVIGTNPDSYSLQIKGITTEKIEFSAPSAGPAVYLSGVTGDGVGAKRQLSKFETDPASGGTSALDGKIFANKFGPEVQAVRQTALGSDGSVYVLADVNGATDGQTIKGVRDVALLKYDSAGKLLYTRTLGAGWTASGYALAVSDDGTRVAVAGSVTGALDYGDAGADAAETDSFVAVFDQAGQPVFSDRRGATAADQVQSVAFGDDGSVFVLGQTSSAMAGTAAVGGQDNYIRGYTPTASGSELAYSTAFTVQYGTTGLDKPAGIAVNGSTLVVAGVENGEAVLRRFDLQASGAPVAGTVRSLGQITGGLAGIGFASDGSLVVAGATSDGNVSAGTVTAAYGGGQEAFVARLAGTLDADPADTLAFYGGGGDRTVTGMTVGADGRAYVTGQLKVTPPPGQTTAFDGYAAAIDVDTGAVGWNVEYRGDSRQAAPTSIAVDTAGASILDRLGLPTGEMDRTTTDLLTASTSVRAGDQFSIRVGRGSAKTITIEDDDTLKTLAAKINRALGFTAKVEIIIENGQDRLKISPISARSPVEIEAGKTGRDALRSLGLTEGLIAPTPDSKKKEAPIYALQLPSGLSLGNEGKIKQASAQLLGALSTVRSIYRTLTAPPESKTVASGPVPAYLTERIASYQRALARLGG